MLVLCPLCNDGGALFSLCHFGAQDLGVLKVLLDLDLLLVDHQEGVKNGAEGQQRDRVEVDRVLLDLNIVALSVPLVYFLLVLDQVLLADRNHCRVPK